MVRGTGANMTRHGTGANMTRHGTRYGAEFNSARNEDARKSRCMTAAYCPRPRGWGPDKRTPHFNNFNHTQPSIVARFAGTQMQHTTQPHKVEQTLPSERELTVAGSSGNRRLELLATHTLAHQHPCLLQGASHLQVFCPLPCSLSRSLRVGGELQPPQERQACTDMGLGTVQYGSGQFGLGAVRSVPIWLGLGIRCSGWKRHVRAVPVKSQATVSLSSFDLCV
jgi:hypothetical protein